MKTKQITQEQTTYLSCAETAKLVRGALKENFPSQKFSVRSSTYSMGASIDVSWTDGVGHDAVNKVIKQFEGAGFDGMVDYKFYRQHWMMPDGTIQAAYSEGSQCTGGYAPEYKYEKPHPDAKKVHMGADYVFAQRDVSREKQEECAKQIAKLNGIEFGSMDDRPDIGPRQGDNWWNITHQFLYNKDLTSDNIKVVATDVTCGSWDEFYELAPSEEDN